MGDKEDYLTSYRVFFENFAATVNPEDQLPVHIAGYTITEAELPGEVLYWTTQYLAEKQCPLTLMTPLRRIILDEVRVASKKQPNEFGYKSDDSVYIALRLMQAVFARVNDVCLRYLDNSRLDTLPPPPPLTQRDLKTVSIATKNSRRVMEDRHIEIGNLEALFGIETTEPTSFYAVYDGHAGSAAATYCAAHLHQYLVESPHFSTDLRRALRDAFLRTDAEFVRKSNQERACGGSTAVAVSVRGRRLLAAWAGDSLALLAKRMRLMQLVRPHKPGRQDERDRIEASGGTVMHWGTWRVNGQLAVSRAIGDAQYKPYVTARPETATVELDGDEDFVVVACDGLWDFVSEDDVALAVYRQIAADPDDLKAVTKRLVLQAKRQGSADNISIIVVFLKDPRDIAADNCPPMDLGLDNALANAPPFVMETEACKRLDGAAAEAEAECCEAEADNGVDNSDSDSEDLGPETAVDVDADDVDDGRNHDPQPPTPPAHTVETNHVDGGLVDNVAESGEESEDEWNYYKGEGDREPREEPDEPPRSETPCQDNSAWETSSVDMNSSPLNPDAPVFVPGVAGAVAADVVLAESPRKPLPMDDLELPDVAQFRTEAVGRPNDLLDLDNCDQLNGHHNISIDEAVKEQLNGNDKCNMDSLGFGFNVGVDSEKINDTGLIQDFERIQKDTTDFCNIQVFQAETNPFAVDGNEELLERLKNKERDPMSMSFYQEKDDDTCDRVDLNAVRTLPDSDDEGPNGEMEENGVLDDKENVDPFTGSEPNNDIIRFDERSDALLNNAPDFGQGDNFTHYNAPPQTFSNIELDSNVQEEAAHTETPESHKLLFEQIPEIPDGKSSELGFAADDETPHDETSHDVDMESKDDSPCDERKFSPEPEPEDRLHEPEVAQNHVDDDIVAESELVAQESAPLDRPPVSPSPAADLTPDQEHDFQQNIVADVHQDSQQHDDFLVDDRLPVEQGIRDEIPQLDADVAVPEIQFETDARSPLPAECPFPAASPAPSPLPAASPAPEPGVAPSPAPVHESPVHESPVHESPVHESPAPRSPSPAAPLPGSQPSPAPSPLPAESPAPRVDTATPHAASPAPVDELLLAASPAPQDLQARLTPVEPEPAAQPSPVPEPSGPAPDIVPEEPPRSDLVTDVDIGIPESRAQEICVPVTSEILDEAEPAVATPPPTPAAAPLSDTPIAADIAALPTPADGVADLATAAAVVAATAATAAVVGKTKAASSATKKPSTTPKTGSAAKPALKAATPAKTPVTAKRPTSATTTPTAKTPAAAKTTPARTPASAPRPAPARTTPAKPSAPATKPAPAKTAAAPAKPPPITRPSATAKPAPAKEPAATAKTAPAARAAPARPAPRPAAARPASATTKSTAAPAPAAARPASARPATTRPAPTAAAPRPKPLEKKPLPNGDVKPSAAKPLPRPAAARPAPRPTPRAAPAAAPATKSAAPKPAPRATRPPVKDADKQSKDLANKRITAKAAPPRTAAPKVPAAPRMVSMKGGVKKPPTEPVQVNGESNGVEQSAVKAPPSPPPTDNALLPDVIA